MSYQLGVDLGTTFTAAAVTDGSPPTMVGLGNRALQIPSVLCRKPDGDFLVGESAERRGLTEPSQVIREFKRRFGDEVPLLIGGEPYSPQDLTATLLRFVVGVATERMGRTPETVVLTHPASWGAYKLRCLDEVVTLADVGPTQTCPEPEAAATEYAAENRVATGDRVAIYDLGGGTFDACVVAKTPDGFQVMGQPQGVAQVGGMDFDEAVFRHVMTVLSSRAQGVDLDDPALMPGLTRLRRECVDAKESLSTDVETVVPVNLPGLDTGIRLTRPEFERLIRPALTTTFEAMDRALTSANVAPADLRAIVLVGGSSRIPLVSELLQQVFATPTALDTHPKHAVALGAVRVLRERSETAARARTPAPVATPSSAALSTLAGSWPPRLPPGLRSGLPPAPVVSRRAALAGLGAAALGLGGDRWSNAPVPPRRVTLWTNQTEPDAARLRAQTASGIRPDVPTEVDQVNIPDAAQYYARIASAAAEGQLPDVVYLQTQELAAWASRSWITPLTGWVERDSNRLQLDDFRPGQLGQLTVDGQLYALPQAISTVGVFYNKTLFDDAGIGVPDDRWTWETYWSVAAEFVRGPRSARTRWGASNIFNNWFMIGALAAEGGSIFSTDGRACVLDRLVNVEVFDVLADGLRSGVLHHPNQGPRLDAFVNQQVALYLNGSYTTNLVRERVGDRFEWDVAPLPLGSTGRRCVSIFGGCWAITPRSADRKAAWDLVTWLTRERPILDTGPGNTGNLPARSSLLPAWAANAAALDRPPAHLGAFRSQVETDATYWRYPKFWSEFDDSWKRNLASWLVSGDSRAMLGTIQQETNAAAERYG